MATIKVKLTTRYVESLVQPTSGYLTAWDTEVAGLYVRVQPTGLKTFAIHKRTPSGTVKRRIGRASIISLDQARTKASKLLALAELGEPLPEPARKAKVAPERKPIETLGDLWRWHTEKVQPGLRPKSLASYRSLWRRHLARLADKQLTEITTPMLRDWHRERTLAAGKTAGNHAVVLVKALLGYAEREHGLAGNPARGIKRNKVSARKRYLEPAELERVLAILRASDSLVDRALEFLLLSGARCGEVKVMTWGDVDLEGGGTWRKPAATVKTDDEQRLPLNSAALELLRGLPRGLPGALVFGLDRHGNSLFRRWSKVRVLASVPDVRIHDLRRSHATALLAAGVELVHVSGLLGHSQLSTTQIYARVRQEQLREASERVVVAFKRPAAA